MAATTTPTTMAPFGGGRRCSLCLLPVTPTTERPYLLPSFLRQLVALVGFDVALPLCDRCHGDVISVIDILRQVDKLQKMLRRNVEGIREKKKVAMELVGPVLTTSVVQDNVAIPPEVVTEFVVPAPQNPLQTAMSTNVASSSQPVLTLSTGDYYLGLVPFTPSTPTATPYQDYAYQEPIPRNNCYQPHVETSDHQQDDDMGGEDSEYFPSNSPQDDDDDDESGDEVSPAQSAPILPNPRQPAPRPPSVTPTCPTRPHQKVRKVRRCPARWTSEQKAVILAKRKSAQKETLGPFETTPDGRLYFDGVEIIKLGDSYSCSVCDWKDANMAIVDMANCPSWRKVRAIKLHVRGKHSRFYRCDKCDRNFSCAKALQSHLVTKFHAENDPTTCAICAMTIPKFNLDSHLFSHKTPAEQEAELASRPRKKGVRNKNPTGQEESDPNIRPPLIRHPRPKTPCDICGRPCSAVYLSNHVWSHKSESEKETARKFGLAPKLLPKPSLPLPKSQCPICSKFVWKEYLTGHMETHKAPQDRPSFPCVRDGCAYVAKRKAMLAMHVRTVHDKHKRIVRFCTEAGCSAKFDTRKGLKYHFERCHDSTFKRFPCHICNITLASQSILKKHMVGHGPAEDYSFLCPHCPFKYNSEQLLHRHLVKEHQVEPKPRYVSKTGRKNRKREKKISEGPRLKNRRISSKMAKTTPVLRLHRLPSQLATGTGIKIISDQVVSQVGSGGEFEIIVLSSD